MTGLAIDLVMRGTAQPSAGRAEGTEQVTHLQQELSELRQEVAKEGQRPESKAKRENGQPPANQVVQEAGPQAEATKPAPVSVRMETQQEAATMGLEDLIEKVEPSVVQVNVTMLTGVATGSGFVLDKRGTIITNYHVIQDATAGTVVFFDKTVVPIAGYTGVWPEKDIVLLHVDCSSEKLHPLTLATLPPRAGERVAAFGSPLGLSRSVSEGIVSAIRQAKEVRMTVPQAAALEVDALLIQTTAPISHGNSGGPLVNAKGDVVGVNTLTFQEWGENLNFAVSSADVQPVLWESSKKPYPLPMGNADQTAGNRTAQFMRRGEAHGQAGNWDAAIADYSEAIGRDPKYADAYCARGLCFGCKRDWPSAVADMTRAIRLSPNNARYYYTRGLIYKAMGQEYPASKDFAKAKKLGYKPAK